jgi:hypothetical protein
MQRTDRLRCFTDKPPIKISALMQGLSNKCLLEAKLRPMNLPMNR